MRHLSRLLDLKPGSTKAAVLKRMRRPPELGTSPVTASLPGDRGASFKLVVEFDRHGSVAFGELVASIKERGEALAEFHRLVAELHRSGVIEPAYAFYPPIRRTTLPMTHLLAWSSWPMGQGRRLQLLVGLMQSAHVQSPRTVLAASIHVEPHRPDYGPRPGDISTGQAIGWDDYLHFARPDLHGRCALIQDAQSSIPVKVEPEPYGSDSVFRIFP